jgi:chromosome segregation ATPase
MIGSKRTRAYVSMLYDKEKIPEYKQQLLEELKEFDNLPEQATQHPREDTDAIKPISEDIEKNERLIRVSENESKKLQEKIDIYVKAVANENVKIEKLDDLIKGLQNEIAGYVKTRTERTVEIEKYNEVITHDKKIIITNEKLISKLQKEVAQLTAKMKDPTSNGGRSRRRHKKRGKKANSYRRTTRRHKKRGKKANSHRRKH